MINPAWKIQHVAYASDQPVMEIRYCHATHASKLTRELGPDSVMNEVEIVSGRTLEIRKVQ
jgi:hypothetical protein